MTNRYTNIILTVIAIALTTMAFQNLFKPAEAQATACGSRDHPCAVVNMRFEQVSNKWLPCYEINYGCYIVVEKK